MLIYKLKWEVYVDENISKIEGLQKSLIGENKIETTVMTNFEGLICKFYD